MDSFDADKPKVSVLIPVYNHGKYIGECIMGVLKQKINFPIEVIIGDDASTDNSKEIILESIKQNKDKLKSIKTLFHKHNLGPKEFPGKFNWLSCIQESSGEYIAFCEGDDFWTDPEKLQKQINFLESNPQCSAVFHAADWFIENSGITVPNKYKPKHIKTQYSITDFLHEKGNPVPTASLLCKNFKNILPDWYKEIFFGDVAIHFVNLKTGPYGYINQSMAVYREHSSGEYSSESLEKNLKRKIESHLIIGKGLDLLKLKEFKNSIFQKYFEYYKYLSKNHKQSNKILLESLKYVTSLNQVILLLKFTFPKFWKVISKVVRPIKGTWHRIKKIPGRVFSKINHLTRNFIWIYCCKYEKIIWLIGSGRSGTTWLSDLINYQENHRQLFEPFHPKLVPEMNIFNVNEYVRPKSGNTELLQIATKVFSGKIINRRVNSDNKKIIYKNLLIKDIFSNLFANYIYKNIKDIKIILIIRNPFAVALSKNEKRDWHWMEDPIEFLNQKPLVEDYLSSHESLIKQVSSQGDFIEKQILIWAIINYVPIRQFKKDEICIVFYENVLMNPNSELQRIEKFIGNSQLSNNSELIENKFQKASKVSKNKSQFDIASWKNSISVDKINSGLKILNEFGLGNLYDENSIPNFSVIEKIQQESSLN